MKYRYPDYMQDYDREERRSRTPRRSSDVPTPTLLNVREVFRCALCGAYVRSEMGITEDSQCPKCGADLHTCKNCVHFDPGSHFECTEPIPERIPRKDLRNHCEFFEPRKVVERETSTSLSNIRDPRAAFDQLFKK